MLSRVAERLYWFARYVERTENTARLLLVRHNLILDLPTSVQPGWDLLIDVMGVRESIAGAQVKSIEKNVVSFVFGDRENPSSIISSLAAARENMRITREVMPSETWERINSLYLSVARRGKKNLPRNSRHKVLNDIIQRCQQITGMLAGCMNHEDAYHFIRIGRNLERGDMSTRIIDVGSAHLLGADDEVLLYRNALWVSVLQSLSAYQMYRLNVRRKVRPDDVLEFLMRNPVFPRSLGHTLQEIEDSVSALPLNVVPIKVIRSVKQKLKSTEVSELRGNALHEFIDELQLQLGKIHHAIVSTWFQPHSVS
ncbi:MAG: alpha-E domain-containing protein [Gammaproteobacteria bacterium]|nr:alpha-E domain-containing protein [Gammaproteobacteria bacterium]MDH5802694.1 alpha-E domain-containing protein [Gammaproteobacteria bacterium]